MHTRKYRDESVVLEDLNSLVRSENFLEAIAEILLRDFAGSVEEIKASDTFDLISYNELAFLIGIWIKSQPSSAAPNDPYILVRQTDALLLEYHNSMYFNNLGKIKDVENLYEFFNDGSLFKEAFFYSATAGYDRQYIKLIMTKYQGDKVWIKDNKQIDLNILPGFFNMITTIINTRLLLMQASKKQLSSKEKLNLFIFEKTVLFGECQKYKSIVDALTTELHLGANISYADIADFNEFLEKPIIKLDDEKYFIPTPYFIAESLYESPFYWMNEDKNYLAIAAKNRGNAAEDLVYQNVYQMFGKDSLFRNVNIKINKTKTLTDIDILACTNDTAIIFQIKSKKLTSLSKKGELQAIKSDFTKAVIVANQQAELSIHALQDYDKYTFETSEGKKIPKLDVERFLTVIVLLDQYPAISHQTHILLGDVMTTPPVAFSIFDLETLVEHLKTGERFADYIHRRTLYSKNYRSANELQYLGYYLKNGMEKLKDNEYVYIDPSFGQDIDAIEQQKRINELRQNTTNPSRNQPCPCGSGRKFKNCHSK